MSSKRSQHVSHQIEHSILSHHQIKEKQRVKMLDWLIQVIRVLNKSSEQTFFLTSRILDMYLQEKGRRSEYIQKGCLQIIGMVSLCLASKIEDVHPIHYSQLQRDAGHNKFNNKEFLDLEKDFLSTLNFKLIYPTVHEESQILFKQLQIQYKRQSISSEAVGLMSSSISFFSYLSSFHLKLQHA